MALRQALAAPHARQGFDRAPGLTGDFRDLPVLGLNIGLGGEISVDPAEFRAPYFSVRGAPPLLLENIEENELLNATKGGASGHASILRMLVDVPPTSTNWRRRRETALVATDPQADSWGSAGLHAASMPAATTYGTSLVGDARAPGCGKRTASGRVSAPDVGGGRVRCVARRGGPATRGRLT